MPGTLNAPGNILFVLYVVHVFFQFEQGVKN